MAFIFACGTGCAAPTKAWGASLRFTLLGTATALLLGASPSGKLALGIDGFRSDSGLVQVCMTRRPDRFPKCERDPQAYRLTVPAAEAAKLSFADLPSGAYAVALFHDENGNGRLDTSLGIPREGFGFSRNPSVMFGPPRFAAAEFVVTGGETSQHVKLKYLL